MQARREVPIEQQLHDCGTQHRIGQSKFEVGGQAACSPLPETGKLLTRVGATGDAHLPQPIVLQRRNGYWGVPPAPGGP